MFEGEGSWNKNEDNKSEFTGDRDDIGVEEKHSTEDSFSTSDAEERDVRWREFFNKIGKGRKSARIIKEMIEDREMQIYEKEKQIQENIDEDSSKQRKLFLIKF